MPSEVEASMRAPAERNAMSNARGTDRRGAVRGASTSLGTRGRADDRWFRLGTGAFAALVLVVVIGIGFELTRQSLLSIEKFGFGFWTGKIWDPVSGDFGALPFIWGTLYSSILALILSTPIAL